MLVTVKNINELEEALPQEEYPEYYADDVFLMQLLCKDERGNITWNSSEWSHEKNGYSITEDNTAVYEFRYKNVVAKSAEATKLAPLFETITLPGVIDNEGIEGIDKVEILVEAHAIQADGFTDADEAWGNFKRK